jgi:hypothetical protein
VLAVVVKVITVVEADYVEDNLDEVAVVVEAVTEMIAVVV